MYVVDVLPLAKGVRAETLSYISPQKATEGTVVTAPMRSRKINAVVLSCIPKEKLESELEALDYELKEIKEVGEKIFFSEFIDACKSFARASGVTTGATIKALTPTRIVKNSNELPAISDSPKDTDITAPAAKIVQASAKKRLSYINSMISRQLADEKSVFVCTPTKQIAQNLAEDISADATIIRLDNDLKKSALLSRWREVVSGGNPVVIVGTAQFLSAPRADLGLVIIADEADDAYKMFSRPHLDRRHFARHFAKTFKAGSILSDTVLSIETLWEYREDKISSAFKPVFHYNQSLNTQLVDMKELSNSSATGVKLFSPKTAKLIRKAAGKEKMILFVARRGQRPFTICNDCGQTLTCERCNYPLVLQEEKGKREFICRNCKERYASSKRCDNCGGWRLNALGVGIDFVADALEEKIPELNLFQIDGGTTQTESQLNKTLKQFRDAESGVLLTTQLGINRLHQDDNVDSAAVVTADSLLALPDLNAGQKLFRLLLQIREHTQNELIIQTRSKQTSIFSQALDGNITAFYRQQISERKQFNYPPFSVLIKLSLNGQKSTVKQKMKKIRKAFSDEDITVYPASGRKTYGAIALVNIARDRWVDKKISQKLQTLPQSVSIDVHPQSLL